MTQDIKNKIKKIENENRIFKSLEDCFDPKQKILWDTLKGAASERNVTHKSICFSIYPGKDYDNSEKRMVSRRIVNLGKSGYIESFDYCFSCGLTFKSIPDVCPSCNTPILDNEDNGISYLYHRPTRKCIEEMDDFYYEVKRFLFDYGITRKKWIKSQILNHINKIESLLSSRIEEEVSSFTWNLSNSLEKIRICILDLKTISPEYYTKIKVDFKKTFIKGTLPDEYTEDNFNRDTLKRLPEQLKRLRVYIINLVD